MVIEKTGKILHLDGDKKYSIKASMYYRKVGLNAIVKNISEKMQTYMIIDLLKEYKPDILVITGHDKILNKSKSIYNAYNYRNSIHFANTVKKARGYINSREDLVIFAGACESYFELIIDAGANFASSPGRIKIDFMDPIAVAEKIATTPGNKYVTLREILPGIRDGIKGVGGSVAIGKYSL